MAILQVDPGGEQYVPFAQKKLREMHADMQRSNLRISTKTVQVSDGAFIYLDSRQVGSDLFTDRIRITVQGGLTLRAPVSLALSQTRLWRTSNGTVVASDVHTTPTPEAGLGRNYAWSKDFTTLIKQTTSTSITLVRAGVSLLIENVTTFDTGPQLGSYQDYHMMSGDGKTVLFRSILYATYAASDAEVLVKAVWNPLTSVFDVTRVSLPSAIVTARSSAGSEVPDGSGRHYWERLTGATDPVPPDRHRTGTPTITFWANRYTGTDVDMEYQFAYPTALNDVATTSIALTAQRFSISHRTMRFSYNTTLGWTARSDTTLSYVYDVWLYNVPGGTVNSPPSYTTIGGVRYYSIGATPPSNYYQVMYSPDGVRHEVTFPVVTDIAAQESDFGVGVPIVYWYHGLWSGTIAATAPLQLDGTDWFAGVAVVSADLATGVVAEPHGVHALGMSRRGGIFVQLSSGGAFEFWWNWDGLGSIVTFGAPAETITPNSSRLFSLSKSGGMLHYRAAAGGVRVWENGALLYSSPAPTAYDGDGVPVEVVGYTWYTPALDEETYVAFDSDKFIVHKNVVTAVPETIIPADPPDPEIVVPATKTVVTTLHIATISNGAIQMVSTIPTSFTVEGVTRTAALPIPAGFIGVL